MRMIAEKLSEKEMDAVSDYIGAYNNLSTL